MIKLLCFKNVIMGDQIGIIDIWDDYGNLNQIISFKNVKSFLLSLLLLPDGNIKEWFPGRFLIIFIASKMN